MDNIIKDLKKGEDYSFRLDMQSKIYDIFRKSNDGEIGWGDFIGEIRHILDEAEKIAKDNWVNF